MSFSDVVEDDAYNYLILIVNAEERKFQLDTEVSVSTYDVALYVDHWGEKFAQLIIIRLSRR